MLTIRQLLLILQTQFISPIGRLHIQAKEITFLQLEMQSRLYQQILNSLRPIIGLGTCLDPIDVFQNSEFYFRHAQYSLGDFRSAANAFERGLNIDPANASLKTGLQNAQARIVPDDDDSPPPLMSEYNTRTPRSTPGTENAGSGAGLGGMADMLSGLGGGGGGMPDITSIMNNPQMMALAQQMAANGGLANLLQNPAIANMVFHCLHQGYDYALIL